MLIIHGVRLVWAGHNLIPQVLMLTMGFLNPALLLAQGVYSVSLHAVFSWL